MTDTLLTIILPTDRKPYIKVVDNTLEALQSEVGGYIETVLVTTDMLAVVNEEGLLMGLPENRWLPGIVGNAVLISSKVKCDGEFVGLPAAKIADILRMFGGDADEN